MGDALESCVKGVESCRDKDVALHLKIVSIAVILAASVMGVGLPILGKSTRLLRAESNPFFVMKSFAAGVILATGFVHMLPDAFDSLSNPCLPQQPWSQFPFAGFVSMAAALFTLMIDFCGTAYFNKKHESSHVEEIDLPCDEEAGERQAMEPCNHRHHHHHQKIEDGPSNNLSMVGIHAHASLHTHAGSRKWSIDPDDAHVATAAAPPPPPNQTHSCHSHLGESQHEDDSQSMQLRHKIISQVLEMGIVAHSVIIGIALGASQSPCTIRPLIAALTFHQFFEGIALGGCIAQAGFKMRSSLWMSFFFSITTPTGIAMGIGISSVYNENSPKALIVEGLFDSVSAGILVYMSLVDLIAHDFLSKRLQSNTRLQAASYTALFLGAGAMSLIAKWS